MYIIWCRPIYWVAHGWWMNLAAECIRSYRPVWYLKSTRWHVKSVTFLNNIKKKNSGVYIKLQCSGAREITSVFTLATATAISSRNRSNDATLSFEFWRQLLLAYSVGFFRLAYLAFSGSSPFRYLFSISQLILEQKASLRHHSVI